MNSSRAFFAACILGLACRAVAASTLYVSTTGSDAHPGSGPQDGQAMRSIQAAVDKLQPGDTLLIRGGTYRETVVFPRSGEAGRPITLKAYQDEKVVVSGCEPVTGWTLFKDNIWRAPMPWTLGPGRNQVFAGGQVMIEARFPSHPAPGLEMYVAGLSPLWPTFGQFSIPDPVKQPGRLVSKLLEGQPDDYWKGALYYGVHGQGWCGQTGVIESSRSGEITVGGRTNGWWFAGLNGRAYKPEEGRGMIVGHIHALAEPGQWYWQDNVLYLIPPQGDRPAGAPLAGVPPAGVEAKRRQLAFDLSARQHIRIEGLGVQAGSMRLEDSAHCTVDGCRLAYISHFTRQYAMGQVAPGRNTIQSGETGIFVGGHDNAFLNCAIHVSAGAGFHLRGYHHTIHNCLIDEVSYTAHYLNAITDAVGDYADYEDQLVGGHVITFNTMRNAGRHFFNFYGNGTSIFSRTRGPLDYAATLFAHNHLYNGMLQTRDAGFLTGYFGSGGTLNGQHSQVVYNVLHDCYDIFGMRIDALGMIYLDEGTCDVDLHHNLLWAAPGSLQRGMWFNTCCTNLREHHNVFHPQFTRTSAALRAADFPEARPFRFGHDFQHPPALPPWPQLVRQPLELSPGRGQSGTRLRGLKDGDWCALGAVDFNTGWQSAVLRFAGGVAKINSDRSLRLAPRHRKATDPLVLEMDHHDGSEEHLRKQWTFLYNIGDKAWVRFSQVPLGQGYRRFRAVYGNDSSTPWRLEVRLDRPDGPLAGQAVLAQTDKVRGRYVQIFGEALGQLSPAATLTRDVFLVFRAAEGKPAVNLEYLSFEQYRGELPLEKKEVQLQLRLGSTTGPVIGQFHPHCTGNADTFREFVTTLEPAHGLQPLFLVVRSAWPVPIGDVDCLRLEKALSPASPSGLGQPPLADAQGAMILPEATNRPQSRPGDAYLAEWSERRGPPPLFVATRLHAPPAIDGQGKPWAAASSTMTLGELCDGFALAGRQSTAWIAYDDQALYVAAKHPLPGQAAPAVGPHLWGQSDGMEIAFQDAGAQRGPIYALHVFPDGYVEAAETDGSPAAGAGQLARAVTCRAVVAADGWSCQLRIPFAACGLSPRTAPQLAFNLTVRKAAEESWACWRGTGGATWQVARAGVLVFPEECSAAATFPRDGLSVWLDAADAATIVKDPAGNVAVWKNKAAPGRDARQAAPEHRPRYVAGAINGRPALRFSERAATRLELPDLADGKLSATIFVVFSNPQPGAAVNHNPRLFTASDGRGMDYQVGLTANVPGTETGGPRQMVAVFRDRWGKQVRIGCFSPRYQTFFTGQIAEILVYARVLTPQEQQAVRIYLLCKWNLGERQP
jgi:hypothetical protein